MGFCKEREAFRLFKLNRLLNLRVLKESYTKRKVSSLQKQIDQVFEKYIRKYDILLSCLFCYIIEKELCKDINPGDHMNKVHWNSIKLQGTVPDNIMKEIEDN